MSARENLPHQVESLFATYQFLANEGDVSRAQFKAKLLTTLTRMEDGVEINAVDFEGARTSGEVLYPAEVVMDALRRVIGYIDAGGTAENPTADPSTVFADFSGCRIET